MSPLRSLPHLPIQFAILKSRYPAWSLGSRGAESLSESIWRVRLAPHPHPIMRRFLYGTTRPGSTTTPRLGDLRPGICSWTRSHLVWRVRPPPSRFGGSRSAGSPKHGLWSRGPISNTSLGVLSCPQHSGYPRGASLTSGTSYMRCYRASATRGDDGVRTSALPQHGSPPPTLSGARAARDTFESPLRSSSHAHSILVGRRRGAISRCTSAAASALAAHPPRSHHLSDIEATVDYDPSVCIEDPSRYVQRLLDGWLVETSSVMGRSTSHFGLRGHRDLRSRSATSLVAVR